MELKPIPGFDGYMASDDGHVWTTKRKGGNARASGQRGAPRQMAETDCNGYRRVSLDQGGRVVVVGVHCLVLMAFVGPCPAGMEACHYPDSTPSNNALSNLRWDTRSENAKDKWRHRYGKETKACSRCLADKRLTEYYADKRAVDGRTSDCKMCHSVVAAATMDMGRKRARNREWMRRYRASKVHSSDSAREAFRRDEQPPIPATPTDDRQGSLF